MKKLFGSEDQGYHRFGDEGDGPGQRLRDPEEPFFGDEGNRHRGAGDSD